MIYRLVGLPRLLHWRNQGDKHEIFTFGKRQSASDLNNAPYSLSRFHLKTEYFTTDITVVIYNSAQHIDILDSPYYYLLFISVQLFCCIYMRKMSFECQSPDQVFRVMRMDRLTGSVAEKALIGKSVADQKGPQPSPVSPSFALLFKALDPIKLKPSTQLLKGKHVDILFGADILILNGNSHQRSSKRRKHKQKITLTTSDSSGTVLPFCRLTTGLNSHPFPA